MVRVQALKNLHSRMALTSLVPKPRPGVFRITKNQHNILQGVSHPDQRISDAEKGAITDWIEDNAKRYWLSEGGPLRPPEEGGADIIFVSLLALPTVPRRRVKSCSSP